MRPNFLNIYLFLYKRNKYLPLGSHLVQILLNPAPKCMLQGRVGVTKEDLNEEVQVLKHIQPNPDTVQVGIGLQD